jgi:predicted kinase
VAAVTEGPDDVTRNGTVHCSPVSVSLAGMDSRVTESAVELRCTRGLPGAGKSTYAEEWVSADRAERARVNLDSLRSMMHGGVYVSGVTEPVVIMARDAMVQELLTQGISVICDDTNLPESAVADLRWLAEQCGAAFSVADLRWVPPDVCIARDAARPRPVGEAVIMDYHQRYIAQAHIPVAAA